MKRKAIPTTDTQPTTDDDAAIVEMLQPGALPGDDDHQADDDDEPPPAAAEAPPSPAPPPPPPPAPEPPPPPPGHEQAPMFLRIGPLKAFKSGAGEWRTQGYAGGPAAAVVAQGAGYQGTASLGQLPVAHAVGATPEAARDALEGLVGTDPSVAAKCFREMVQW